MKDASRKYRELMGLPHEPPEGMMHAAAVLEE